MNTQFRISGKLASKLEEAGVRPADVLRQAGLPTGLFDQEKIVLSTAELFALYRGLAEASRDPAIGLKLGTENRLAQYDPLAIAAVTARSFRDAIERLDRYKKLTCPEALVVVDQGNESRVEFRYLLAEETEPPVMVDL
ncbi:MAG: AraC family transcriptional regulator ligand-binding domain-containing protein, partial [Gemmatimonadota bacterium]